MMRIAAVVVTRDRPDLLAAALESLRAQTTKISHIVVVDNASGQATVDLLASKPWIEVVRLERNSGGAGGFAAGIKVALERKVDWIFLLDDDVVLELDALAQMVQTLPSLSKEVGVLCSAVREEGKTALLHRRKFDSKTLREPAIPESLYHGGPVEIDAGSFVGFLLKAEAARDVGLPHAEFFVAYDDTEYSLRLRRRGWQIFLIPHSILHHKRNLAKRMRKRHYDQGHYYSLRNQLAVLGHYGQASRFRLAKPVFIHFLLAASTCGFQGLRLFFKALKDCHDLKELLKFRNNHGL